MFFVSVASKGVAISVSLLFATLAGRSISVASKGVKAILGGSDSVVAGTVRGAEETTGNAIEVVEGQADERQDRVREWELLVHPGSFRKRGNYRTYAIRSLEECTENWR